MNKFHFFFVFFVVVELFQVLRVFVMHHTSDQHVLDNDDTRVQIKKCGKKNQGESVSQK